MSIESMRGLGLGLTLLGAALLSGCAAGSSGFEAKGDGTGTTLGNLIAFNKFHVGPTPAAAVASAEPTEIVCPPVEILDGTAGARVYTGADQSNSNVKYQFSMGDVVRECSKAGNQLVLKVGVGGRVLLGPAGAPGSFSAPVRIAVRNDDSRTVVTSKLYSVPVSVGTADGDGEFSLVSDPIAVPFIKANADEDYTIVVGFDVKGGTTPAPAGRHVSRKRRAG